MNFVVALNIHYLEKKKTQSSENKDCKESGNQGGFSEAPHCSTGIEPYCHKVPSNCLPSGIKMVPRFISIAVKRARRWALGPLSAFISGMVGNRLPPGVAPFLPEKHLRASVPGMYICSSVPAILLLWTVLGRRYGGNLSIGRRKAGIPR